MTTRNKRKLAALKKENCEEHPRSNLAQNSSAPRSQEDYITQVSEEIEGRVTKRLSKEFSRTENRILGALARLDDFLMNPLLPGHSGTTRSSPGTHYIIARERMRTTPRMILILKRVSSTARQRKTLAQEGTTTWWQEPQNRLIIATIWLEFTRKSHTAPLVPLQENRRKTVLPVNHNSTVRTPPRRSRQTKFCWPFSCWQITTILRIFTKISTKFPNCQSH